MRIRITLFSRLPSPYSKLDRAVSKNLPHANFAAFPAILALRSIRSDIADDSAILSAGVMGGVLGDSLYKLDAGIRTVSQLLCRVSIKFLQLTPRFP